MAHAYIETSGRSVSAPAACSTHGSSSRPLSLSFQEHVCCPESPDLDTFSLSLPKLERLRPTQVPLTSHFRAKHRCVER